MTGGRLGAGVGLAAGLAVLSPVLGRGFVLSYDMVFVPDPPITATVLGADGSVPRAVPTELVADLLAVVLPAQLVQQAVLLAIFVLAGAGAARLVPGRAGAAAAALAYAWTPYVAERLVIGHWTFLLGYALLPWVVGAALAVRAGRRGGLAVLLLWLGAAALAGSTSALIATGTALAVLGTPGRAARRPGPDPPAPDPPGADPSRVDPPGVDPPGADPSRVDPPGVDPPDVDAPGADPPGAPDPAAAGDPDRPQVPGRVGRAVVGRAAVVLGFAVLVNASWLVPALTRPGGVPADPAGVPAFAARADTPLGLLGSLLTLGGIWNPAAWPAGRDSVLAAVALAAVAAALALGLRPLLTGTGAEERAGPASGGVGPASGRVGGGAGPAGLVVAAVAGLVLAGAGAVPGLDEALTWAVVHVPGGGLLRDGQKLLAPAALLVALAAGYAVRRLAATRRTVPYAVLLAVLPVLALPTLAWGIGGRLAPAGYPPSWAALRAAVDAAPPGEVASLPWTLYRRLDLAGDRVVLDPLPRLLDRRVLVNDDLALADRTVRGEDTRAAGVTAGLAAGRPLPDLLRAAGVRYAVLLRGQPGSAAAESALAGLPVRLDTPDLLLVELPGEVADPPPTRPWVAALGLGITTAALVGAAGAVIHSRVRRRLLGSADKVTRR